MTMKALLSIKSKTGEQLARELGFEFVLADPLLYLGSLNKAIRWGYYGGAKFNIPTLNSAAAIRLVTNKPKCRVFLRERGFPVPSESENKFPVIGRPKNHKAGSKFWICNNDAEVWEAKLKGAAYFQRYYPKRNEYRVHVGGGRVLLMSIKEGDKTQVIWNKKRSNFNFRHLKRSVWLNDPLLRKIARKSRRAIEAVGLDFGAVDIMADAGEGWRPFVIAEINSAPSLSPLAISKYVKYFREVFCDHVCHNKPREVTDRCEKCNHILKPNI